MFRKSRPAGPQGHRAYAIGDVHGRLDLLDELLGKIDADNATRSSARTTIIFLGDLIDRGPDSAGVVERLRNYRPPFASVLFVMGNHEEVMLRILAGETDLLPDWMKFGGAETVRSYGLDPLDLQCRDRASALKLLRRAINKDHLEFMGSFVDSASFGRYLFVHAGIRPGIALDDQLPTDLRWIRAPFLDDDRDHGKVVVHGHTISGSVEIRDNRIGLDTGAYSSGILSAVGLEGDDRWFIQTGGEPRLGPEARTVANYSDAL